MRNSLLLSEGNLCNDEFGNSIAFYFFVTINKSVWIEGSSSRSPIHLETIVFGTGYGPIKILPSAYGLAFSQLHCKTVSQESSSMLLTQVTH